MIQNRQTMFSLLVTAAIMAAALTANAEPADPVAVRRELLEAMIAHVQHGRHKLALVSGKAALEYRRDRETLCNTGLVAAYLESFVEAAEYLSECIALTKEPTSDEKELEKRVTHASTLAMARTQIGTLRIVATPLASVTVDHRRIGLAPIDRDVFVTPNKPIDIHGEYLKNEDTARVTIPPGQTKTVVLHIKTPMEDRISKPLSVSAPPPAPVRSSIFPSNKPFWISLISTVAATGATGHFAISSKIDSADYQDRLATVRNHYACGCECNVQPDCATIDALQSRAHHFQNLAIASGITAGIGLALTIAFGKYWPVQAKAKGFEVSF